MDDEVASEWPVNLNSRSTTVKVSTLVTTARLSRLNSYSHTESFSPNTRISGDTRLCLRSTSVMYQVFLAQTYRPGYTLPSPKRLIKTWQCNRLPWNCISCVRISFAGIACACVSCNGISCVNVPCISVSCVGTSRVCISRVNVSYAPPPHRGIMQGWRIMQDCHTFVCFTPPTILNSGIIILRVQD